MIIIWNLRFLLNELFPKLDQLPSSLYKDGKSPYMGLLERADL